MTEKLQTFYEDLILCNQCPRLVQHRMNVGGKFQPKKWRNTPYWSKPVPGFGDPKAEIFIVGLAPGLHGANRTGRPFTGDGAGVLLYHSLYEMGWANMAEVTSKEDGLELKNVFISNIVKCAPPGNVPLTDEKNNCHPFFWQELKLLPRIKVILALGSIAHNEILRILKKKNYIKSLKMFPFKHGEIYKIPGWKYRLIDCYHPSTYNVNTGVLNLDMMLQVFSKIKEVLDNSH